MRRVTSALAGAIVLLAAFTPIAAATDNLSTQQRTKGSDTTSFSQAEAHSGNISADSFGPPPAALPANTTPAPPAGRDAPQPRNADDTGTYFSSSSFIAIN